jgi:hypothetical protein
MARASAHGLDRLETSWRSAFDAAAAALVAAAPILPLHEESERARRLADERLGIAQLLDGIARDAHSIGWLSHVAIP